MTTDMIIPSSDELSLVKATVAKGCNDVEFKMLLYQAKVLQLDPLTKQIWAVKYGDSPALIFVGRDGYNQIAHRSGKYDGMISKYEDASNTAWAEVYRKDMSHPFRVEVSLKEYNTGKGNWLKMPKTMLVKVAESQALRRAFAISGVYSPEEIREDIPASETLHTTEEKQWIKDAREKEAKKKQQIIEA